MSAGLYSREVVAKLLGKKVTEIERMIQEDGLPAVALKSGQRVRYKFAASMLLVWMNQHTRNQKWTIEMLIQELDRCDRVDQVDRNEEVAA
jgi:hypothetical protein